MQKIVVVLATLMIAACASSPKTVSQTNETNIPSAEKQAAAPVMNPLISAAEMESKRLAAEIQELQKQSIYFDYNRFNVKSEYHDVIEKQAEFIKNHKNDVVTVEGNTDERGSSEYNLALGDKRANAARKNLELLGVPEAQVKVVSLGEGKPRLTCHEEKCWKEDRRDDFIHSLN